MLSLPLDLGEGIILSAGKFGPYIKQGGKSKSLTGSDTIFTMTLERAKELLSGVAEKPAALVIGTHPTLKAEITLNNGRYGPYLKCGKNNYALPKNLQGKEITLEEAITVINAKK